MLRFDAEPVAQLQALAVAENRSLTDYVETAVLRDLSRREEAERVITMYVVPGVADSIRPEDVVRAEGESDEDYAERQTLTAELWSIPHNARPSLKGLLLAEEGRGDIRLLPRGRRRTRIG